MNCEERKIHENGRNTKNALLLLFAACAKISMPKCVVMYGDYQCRKVHTSVYHELMCLELLLFTLRCVRASECVRFMNVTRIPHG